MTYRIARQFTFSASHQLSKLPEGHKCKRLHGHNYQVTLIFKGEGLDQWDMVRDFDSLSQFAAWIDTKLDHRHLNDVLTDRREAHAGPLGHVRAAAHDPIEPTSENLARFIFETWAHVWGDLEAVRVSEGLDTWAEFTR